MKKKAYRFRISHSYVYWYSTIKAYCALHAILKVWWKYVIKMGCKIEKLGE